MKRSLLLVYQIGIACSDTFTGASLMIAPAFTMRLMGIAVDPVALVFIGYVGAFVLGVGLCCAYGAFALIVGGDRRRVQMVWLLTAILRISVAVFIAAHLFSHQLAAPWISVALFDGLCAFIQAIGLQKEWLNDGAL